MNYRHAFHAGNFADVVKHVVLTRILLHLLKKETPFRVIDTHAGAAIYDLTGPAAARSGEWKDGIGRIVEASFDQATDGLIAPYLDAVRAVNVGASVKRYPGSPALIGFFLRRNDRLIACEFEPSVATALARHVGKDKRIKAIEIDGWTALAAYIPPKERRGLVLIDPPFEERDEFARLADAFIGAHHKWPDGIYVAWYPVKDARDAANLARSLSRSGIPKLLRAELTVANPGTEGLRGTGLIVANPPWTLEGELKTLLPNLARALAPGRKEATLLHWLARESR